MICTNCGEREVPEHFAESLTVCFQCRLEEMLADEGDKPRWWYLSFSGPGEWLGACIVKATGEISAIKRAHELGINPGGQVMSIPIDGEPKIPRNKLLSKAELEEWDQLIRVEGEEGDFHVVD